MTDDEKPADKTPVVKRESDKTRAHAFDCHCDMCWGTSFRDRLRREKYER